MTILFSTILTIATLGLLQSLRSKRTGNTALLTVCDWLCAALAASACAVMAFAVGIEAGASAFWLAARAEYQSKWRHIAAAPAREAK
jgi:hypothetical protein